MSFELNDLQDLVAKVGPVTRVVVAATRGSAPREVGASLCVWPGGQSGTIGGGALEFEAAKRAVRQEFVEQVPLGPARGQCCGGSVTLVAERFDADRLSKIEGPRFARSVTESGAEPPLSHHRAVADARAGKGETGLIWADGWLSEPIGRKRDPIWIWGAGHVGRALIETLAPLPDAALTWVDTALDRFPSPLADGVTQLVAANPGDLVAHAPQDAQHVIVTYSHAIDLDLCHRLLAHGFAHIGLIGSKTKWARFRKRLQALGHSPQSIDQITCPIGDPAFGKHPQAIAISVAADLLQKRLTQRVAKEAVA